MHQCYYCEQLFGSKEELYDHVEVHSDVERNVKLWIEKKQAEKNNLRNKTKKNRVKVRFYQILEWI